MKKYITPRLFDYTKYKYRNFLLLTTAVPIPIGNVVSIYDFYRLDAIMLDIYKELATTLLPVGMFYNKYITFEFATINSPSTKIDWFKLTDLKRGDVSYVFWNNRTKKDYLDHMYLEMYKANLLNPKWEPNYIYLFNLNIKVFPGKRPQDLTNYNNIALLNSTFIYKTKIK